jgi:hemolysin D
VRRALRALTPGKEDKDLVVEFLPDADELERTPLPPYLQITMRVLFGGLALFLIWASFSKIDRVVVAQGRLVTPDSNTILQPLETSIIRTINVQVGQMVKKGDVLATLDPTFTQADDAQLRIRLQSLDTQIKGLQGDLNGGAGSDKRRDADSELQARMSVERQGNYAAQKARMNESIERLKASLETNIRDQQVLGARTKSVREIEAMQEKLVAQNFGARIRLLEAQDKRLEVERDLNMTKNREQEIKRELASLEADKSAFEKGWRLKLMEDLLTATRERDSVNQQLAKADRRNKLVNMVAPVDAVVLDIAKVAQGSIIREAETMFTLVPLGAELEAEVHIDSLDVGYMKTGLPAHIKIDAFPFQQHGALDATVRTVSEDAFRREASTPGGMDAYYVSRINFGKSKLKKLAPHNRLLPGMTLSAEIVVGKRTVISYLVWPLTKGLSEALSEP